MNASYASNLSNDSAKQRLLTFDSIIDGKLQKAFEASSAKYQQAWQTITDLSLATTDEIQSRLLSYVQLSEEHGKQVDQLNDTLHKLHMRLEVAKRLIIDEAYDNLSELPPLPQDKTADIQGWIASIDQELPSLISAIENGASGLSSEQQTALEELQSKKALWENKNNLVNCPQIPSNEISSKKVRELSDTAPITRQQNSRTDIIVTEKMRQSYSEELARINLVTSKSAWSGEV